jgi:hypothetical protein
MSCTHYMRVLEEKENKPRRTSSIQVPLIPSASDDIENNQNAQTPARSRATSSLFSMAMDTMMTKRKKCCYGYLVQPSIEIIILHTALFSYSTIVKTTMSLLHCQQSPINDHQTVMYLAGTVIQATFPTHPLVDIMMLFCHSQGISNVLMINGIKYWH